MLSFKILRRLSLSTLATLALSAGGASAKPPTQDGEERGQRRGPPPEALEACATLSEGASCGFSGHRGEVNGTCIVPRNQTEVLACAPAGHENRRREGPGDRQEQNSLTGVAQPTGYSSHGHT